MTARSTKTATNDVSRLDGLSPMAFILVARLEQSPQDLVSAARAPAVVSGLAIRVLDFFVQSDSVDGGYSGNCCEPAICRTAAPR